MSITTPSPGPATVIAAAEVLQMPSGAFHLLADASATGGALGVNRLTLGTGANGALPHFHAKSTELIYVAGGAAEFFLEDRMTTVSAGGLVVIPPGLPHAFGAAPGTETDLIAVITPGVERFGYFRQLQRIALGQAGTDSLLADQERYDVHFVTSPVWQAARRS